MEQRISVVTLGVDHLDRSRRFYVDGLGWKPGFENEEIIFFQTGGIVFALFLRDKLAEDFQGDSRGFGRAAMSFGHNVREKSEVDRLKILKSAEDKSWGGYSGYFAGPDGFLW